MQAALDVAFRLLSYTSRTSRELEERLSAKGFAPGVIRAVIQRLHRLNYLDDRAYAVSKALQMVESKGFGSSRIEWELVKRGVPRQYVEEAMERVNTEFQQEALAEKALGRYLRRRPGTDPSDPRIRRRIIGHLKRRGFSDEVIISVLKNSAGRFAEEVYCK